MIVLSRKRLLSMVCMVCLSIFAFSFHISKNDNAVETVTLPVTNKTIVIDARTWKAR